MHDFWASPLIRKVILAKANNLKKKKKKKEKILWCQIGDQISDRTVAVL